jgi:DNA cross-link repair 1A protein
MHPAVYDPSSCCPVLLQLMREALQDEPETLLVVSSYHIGKERAYLGAAAALGLQVRAV